jgi:hypothetical protein
MLFLVIYSSSSTVWPSPPGTICARVSSILAFAHKSYHADVVAVEKNLRKLDVSLGGVAILLVSSDFAGSQVLAVNGYAHLSHVFQYHVYHVVSGHSTYNAIAILTDIVVEAYQLSRELCLSLAVHAPLPQPDIDLPLPPFIMTHICEPTHLSMSSGRRQWAHTHTP